MMSVRNPRRLKRHGYDRRLRASLNDRAPAGYRSRTDRMIAGDVRGFSRVPAASIEIVRLVMVCWRWFGGSGVVLYLVAWAIVPVEDAGR